VVPTSIAEAIWEVLMEWGNLTRWLRSRLACDDSGGHQVRVGDGSTLKVSVLVVERNFAKFSCERARDDLGKHHESSLWVQCHGEVPPERASAISGANPEPKTKVSPRLKATVG
jgi:hypothetical protein